jgi:hypothetical protein
MQMTVKTRMMWKVRRPRSVQTLIDPEKKNDCRKSCVLLIFQSEAARRFSGV